MRNFANLVLVFVLAGLAGCGSTEPTPDHPMVGTWSTVSLAFPGDTATVTGLWTFHNDFTHTMDMVVVWPSSGQPGAVQGSGLAWEVASDGSINIWFDPSRVQAFWLDHRGAEMTLTTVDPPGSKWVLQRQ